MRWLWIGYMLALLPFWFYTDAWMTEYSKDAKGHRALAFFIAVLWPIYILVVLMAAACLAARYLGVRTARYMSSDH